MTRRKTILVVIVLLLIISIFLIPFIRGSRFDFSNDTLSSLGSYLSSIVSIINLVVFVYLTGIISRYENIRSENEIKTQKLITQTQFRQSELEKLIKELDKPFESDGTQATEESVHRIVRASAFLNNFLNQKQYLFPLIQDQNYSKLGNIINDSFSELISLLEGDPEKNMNLVEEQIIKVYDQKSDFIHVLQTFIIQQLER
jgi:predicted CopG family antitoxin